MIANDEVFQLKMMELQFLQNYQIKPITVFNGKMALDLVKENLSSIQNYYKNY